MKRYILFIGIMVSAYLHRDSINAIDGTLWSVCRAMSASIAMAVLWSLYDVEIRHQVVTEIQELPSWKLKERRLG
jgi:hypothetical protein